MKKIIFVSALVLTAFTVAPNEAKAQQQTIHYQDSDGNSGWIWITGGGACAVGTIAALSGKG